MKQLIALGVVLVLVIGASTRAAVRRNEALASIHTLSAQQLVESNLYVRQAGERLHLDFVSVLPCVAGESSLFSDFHRSLRESGVQLASASLSSAVATDSALGKTELTASLDGHYAVIKRVISDVLGRYPHVTMSRMRLSRRGVASEVTAQVVLSSWSAASFGASSPSVREEDCN